MHEPDRSREFELFLLAIQQYRLPLPVALQVATQWLDDPEQHSLALQLQHHGLVTESQWDHMNQQWPVAGDQPPTLQQTLIDHDQASHPEFQALLAELNQLVQSRSGDPLSRSVATVLGQWPAPSASASSVEARDSWRDSTAVGSMVGPFRLVKLLGEGGMGSVWLAEQTAPVQRRVAVKLIKDAGAQPRLIARFELERQALAMMDHAHIARVLEAGATADGQPFVAMELIEGVPLNEYCDAAQLSLHDRLRLFLPICAAVQHAHQKGIIHRDLKPNNILVATSDKRPVPKVIDFGLAKPIDWSGQAGGLHPATLNGQIVGTLRYMSPEQAESGAQDIDTRTDIYSLGIILYELLTGSTPLDRQTQANQSLREILAVICQQDSPRPSSCLSSSTHEHVAQIARERRLTPQALHGLLSGELDWIVMKAIQKDRQLRYQSAAALAEDIERFLNHEPVTARPPSRVYRLKKFVNKHRSLVVAASLILISLVSGVLVSTLNWLEARQQKTQAMKRLEQIELGNQILADIFSDLNILSDATQEKPLESLLADRLVRAGDLLKGDAIGDPQTTARLQDKLARALFSLGKYEAALKLFDSSSQAYAQTQGLASLEYIECLHNMGSTLIELRQLDQALECLQLARTRATESLGATHPATLKVVNGLASAYASAGRFEEALPMFRENMALMRTTLPEDMQMLTCANGLAFALQATGDLPAAIALFEEVLAQRRIKLGDVHPETLVSANNLAFAYYQADRQADAVKLFESTYELSRARLGPDSPQTLTSQANYAKVLIDSGQVERGATLLVESVQLQRSRYVLSPERYASLQANVAVQLMQVEQWSQAETILRDCYRLRSELQPDHWSTFNTASMLGESLLKQGQTDAAEELLLKGYAGLAAREESIPPAALARIQDAVQRLIQLYQLTQQPEEAAKWSKLMK